MFFLDLDLFRFLFFLDFLSLFESDELVLESELSSLLSLEDEESEESEEDESTARAGTDTSSGGDDGDDDDQELIYHANAADDGIDPFDIEDY